MAGPGEGLDKCRRWLELYTEDSLYKVLGKTFNREKSISITQLIVDKRGKEVLSEIERCDSNGNTVERDTLFYATALCVKSSDHELKQHAYKTFVKICKSPRELFTFLKFLRSLSETKSWGRSLKRAVSNWYNSQDPLQLAKITTKEVSFADWSHRDALRLGHIKGKNDSVALIFKYLVQGVEETKKSFDKPDISDDVKKVLDVVMAIHNVKHSEDEHEVARLVEIHNLQKEHVSTKMLNSKEVWSALLNNMTVMEMLENIGKLASVGFLDEAYNGSKAVIEKLKDETLLKQQRVQPFCVLIARNYYEHGKGGKPPAWKCNNNITSALDFALDISIKNNVKSTNKRYLIAVRVGSNKVKTSVRGTRSLPNMTAAAAVAMVTARKEDKVDLVYFTDKATQLPLTSETQMKDIADEIATQVVIADTTPGLDKKDPEEEEAAFCGVPPDPCDLTAPIRWATENRKCFDVFLLLIDSRMNTGQVKPSEALMQYRKEMDLPNAKLITLGLTTSGLKFADPEDSRMLDISGFDATVPNVINKFITEEF